MGWENGACSQKPISISRPAKSLHVGSGGHTHQALQNKTPDEVYKTAAGGGALIVQKYKTQCEKSDEIAPAVDNCPAHRTSLWTAGAMPRYGSCPPLPELEPTA